MPTVVPFHRAVLDDPAFTAPDGHFGVHTRWIETEFAGEIPPYDGPTADATAPEEKTRVVVEVDGKRLEVVLPAGLGRTARHGGARSTTRRARPAPGRRGRPHRAVRERLDVAHAGHDRQGRRRRGRRGRGG